MVDFFFYSDDYVVAVQSNVPLASVTGHMYACIEAGLDTRYLYLVTETQFALLAPWDGH